MRSETAQNSVAKYYSRVGSRLGYKLVMKDSQHFGYYNDAHDSERTAQQKYHEEFSKLLDLEPGMNVLDAGCGQGVVACYLTKYKDVHVTGITIVPYEVKSAQQRALKQNVQAQTRFLLADYATPPLEPQSFDRIYTTETLSHALDVKEVLEVFMTLLKPGGKLICAEYEFDYDKFGEQGNEYAQFVKRYAAINAMYEFGIGQFVSNLKVTSIKEVKTIDWTPQVTPSFKRLARLAGPIVPIVKKLHLEKYFVNTIAANSYAWYREHNAIFYRIYTAVKKA